MTEIITYTTEQVKQIIFNMYKLQGHNVGLIKMIPAPPEQKRLARAKFQKTFQDIIDILKHTVEDEGEDI